MFRNTEVVLYELSDLLRISTKQAHLRTQRVRISSLKRVCMMTIGYFLVSYRYACVTDRNKTKTTSEDHKTTRQHKSDNSESLNVVVTAQNGRDEEAALDVYMFPRPSIAAPGASTLVAS